MTALIKPETTSSDVIASRRIPRGIWILGFVSLLMDISSEMIHALLPVYMVTVLGTSVFAVGVIEGVAEATASITKVFSGFLSDRLGKRKALAAFGYALAAFTKPVFPLAASLDWLVTARFIDRVGKGIRGAPRDALVADISPPELRGASFGLRQSLDTIGAFVGPLLAIGLMWWTAENFRIVFWVAVVPAFLSVGLIVFGIKEPKASACAPARRPALRWDEIGHLGSTYWWVVTVASVFTLARFSEAFLVLRAQSIGLDASLIPAVLVVMSLAYALSAYPAGVLSDRVDRVLLLAVGIILLIVGDIMLALTQNLVGAAFGIVLWGLHMGFTQGIFATMVADVAPAELRGTAFGLFNLAVGISMLAASAIAGAAWDMAGPQGTFLLGAGFAAFTLLATVILRRRLTEA